MKFTALKNRPVKCQWMLHGLYYSGTAHYLTGDGKTFLPSHFKVYCAECGDVWAERRIMEGPKTRWWTKELTCEKHTKGGGLWIWYDQPWNESLPSKLLKREVLVKTEKKNDQTAG